MDSNVATRPGDSETVMAAIEGEGESERLIIADVSRDRAWLAAPTSSTRSLRQWR